MALWLVAIVFGAGAIPAAGEVENITQHEQCVSAELGEVARIRQSLTLSPPDGGTGYVGEPVTLAVAARLPLTFRVASSPALIEHPDIDLEPGTPQPGSSPEDPTYTYTSAGATAVERTVYWAVSFEPPVPPECATPVSTHSLYHSEIYALRVIPAPVSPVRMAAPVPPSAQVTIALAGRLRSLSRVAYGVRCSQECTGSAYVRAYLVRGSRRVRLPGLDFVTRRVSIPGEWGGEQLVTGRYSPRALRLLRRVLHRGGRVELLVSVEVKDLNGHTAQAHASTRLAA